MSGGWKLPADKRHVFKEYTGVSVKEADIAAYRGERVVSVGDVVSLTARNCGITPVLSIYDGLTERQKMDEFANFVDEHKLKRKVVSNPSGVITTELTDAVKHALATGDIDVIYVVGEEDLALIPCVLYASDGTKVIYGDPGKGMAMISVNASVRNEAQTFLGMMEVFE